MGRSHGRDEVRNRMGESTEAMHVEVEGVWGRRKGWDGLGMVVVGLTSIPSILILLLSVWEEFTAWDKRLRSKLEAGHRE